MSDHKTVKAGALADALTPNQIVAYNLARARALRGMTQEEAGKHLAAYLGPAWERKATVSAAERSVDGKVIREFTADDLLAFSRTFRLPIAWFLMPPSTTELGRLSALRAPDGSTRAVAYLLEDLFGTEEGRSALAARVDEVLAGDRHRDWRTPEQQDVSDYLDMVVSGLLREQLQDVGLTAKGLRRLAERLDRVQRETRRPGRGK